MFDISMTNNINISSKIFYQHNHQITDNQCTKEELNLLGYDLVAE